MLHEAGVLLKCPVQPEPVSLEVEDGGEVIPVQVGDRVPRVVL